MRILTMFSGLIMLCVGMFLIANEGITFLSIAFLVGLVLTISGIVECLSYNSYRGNIQEKAWVLMDGTTTFVLGCLILLDKLSGDLVVPYVLALWVLITGIRNFTRTIELSGKKDAMFFEHLIIGTINVVYGIYVFFDKDYFNLATITLIGAALLVQGLNLMLVGGTIKIRKPEFAKSKHEKLQELQVQAEEAHLAAKEAIRLAKEAKAELKEVEETPEELFDPTMAPSPAASLIGAVKAVSAEENSAENGEAEENA